MSTFYANKITMQISDTVRLIFQDERAGIQDYPIQENPHLSMVVGEVVLSLPNARAMRDLLVQHLKDDQAPLETMQ